jgi:hypothetical protein
VRLSDGSRLRADTCVLPGDPATTRHLGPTCGFVADDDPRGHTSWRDQPVATPHRTPVRRLAAVAGSSRADRSAAYGWVGGRAARLRAAVRAGGRRRSDPDEAAAARRAGPDLPGDRGRPGRQRGVAGPRRLPSGGYRPLAPKAGRRDPDPRLVLAGNALLGRWQVAGHDLWTVPMAGRRPVGRAAALHR